MLKSWKHWALLWTLLSLLRHEDPPCFMCFFQQLRHINVKWVDSRWFSAQSWFSQAPMLWPKCTRWTCKSGVSFLELDNDQLADIKMHPNLRSVQQNSAQPGVGQSLLAPNVVSSQGPLTLNCTASFRSLGISLAGAAFHRQLSMLMAAALPILTFKVYCLCCIRWWWLLITSKVLLLVIQCFRLKVADFPVQILLMLIQESQPAGSQRIFNSVGILLAKVHTVAPWPMPCFQLGPEFLGAGKRSGRRSNIPMLKT